MSTSLHHLGNHDQRTPEAAVMPLAAGSGLLGLDRSGWPSGRDFVPAALLGGRGKPIALNVKRWLVAIRESRRG